MSRGINSGSGQSGIWTYGNCVLAYSFCSCLLDVSLLQKYFEFGDTKKTPAPRHVNGNHPRLIRTCVITVPMTSSRPSPEYGKAVRNEWRCRLLWVRLRNQIRKATQVDEGSRLRTASGAVARPPRAGEQEISGTVEEGGGTQFITMCHAPGGPPKTGDQPDLLQLGADTGTLAPAFSARATQVNEGSRLRTSSDAFPVRRYRGGCPSCFAPSISCLLRRCGVQPR